MKRHIIDFLILFYSTETNGGNVGLAIYQAICLTGVIQWGIRQSVELENQMTSVERVLQFSTNRIEPTLTIRNGKMDYYKISQFYISINFK